jgi:hypothetical protein
VRLTGKKLAVVAVCLAFGCALNAQSAAGAGKTGNDANPRLEEALSGGPAVQTARGGSRPRWASNPYSDYPQSRYIAAVGTAGNRADAEKQAFAALVSYFGQSVQSDYAVAAAYSEAVTNGIVSVSENTEVRELIVTAASLDRLVGAAIGNAWEDGRGTVYALAYLEKEKTVSIYYGNNPDKPEKHRKPCFDERRPEEYV